MDRTVVTEGAQATRIRPDQAVSLPTALRSAWSWLGVGAITAAAAAFLLHQLMAWPPHEDETLALLVGRDSLGGVIDHVTRERGGAPLHFVFAWAVAHAGLGLGGLRLVSAALAAASLPLVTLLGTRLADRRTGLLATALVAGSWVFLFHGVYARMYSLFLFTSLLATLALLRALDRDTRGAWALWIAAGLAAVAAHPYGALVLAAHGLYIVVARRDRRRSSLIAGAVLLAAGIPFWLTDLVLAGRFEVGVGGGGEKLGGPWSVAQYLWRTAGDFSAGWRPVLIAVIALVVLGAFSLRRTSLLLAAALVAAPAAAFLAARLGGSTSPESRHLIFVLPVFAVLLAAGILRVTRRRPALAVGAAALLLAAEIGWAWHRTPPLFEWEPDARQTARQEASAYLASSARADDVLFGYEPLYLDAWERSRNFPRTVLPRADATLMLRILERQTRPLGRGVWVHDASERNNLKPRLEIELRSPRPAEAFEVRRFGPFLVVRTKEPTGTPDRYLLQAARAQVLGRGLGIGDADVNMRTVELADRTQRGYGASARSRSSNSR